MEITYSIVSGIHNIYFYFDLKEVYPKRAPASGIIKSKTVNNYYFIGTVSKTAWTKKKTYSLGKSTGWNFSEILNKNQKTEMCNIATHSSKSAKLFLEV